jgi:cytochrome c biogenesis protein CcdA
MGGDEATILGTFAATLFALVNPLGMLPVFIGYTAGRRAGVQRWLAIFVSITVLGLMLLFLFAGTALLKFFGITLDAFRIAGGILLLLIGIRTVAHDAANKTKDLAVTSEAGELKEAESVYGQSWSRWLCRYWSDRSDRKSDSIRRRGVAKAKRLSLLGIGWCNRGNFRGDTRNSAFGQILAAAVRRCWS